MKSKSFFSAGVDNANAKSLNEWSKLYSDSALISQISGESCCRAYMRATVVFPAPPGPMSITFLISEFCLLKQEFIFFNIFGRSNNALGCGMLSSVLRVLV